MVTPVGRPRPVRRFPLRSPQKRVDEIHVVYLQGGAPLNYVSERVTIALKNTFGFMVYIVHRCS